MTITVCLIGGAGYIGSHTAYAMIAAGYRVIIVDDLSTGFRRLVPDDAVFVEGDGANKALLDQVFTQHKPQAVVHFAAKTAVAESVQDPLTYYQVNIGVTIEVLRAIERHSIKSLVFSSSAAVYGNPDKVPVDEESPCRPLSPYGHSKSISERIIKDGANAYGLGYVCLRYFNVAGADPDGRTGQIAYSPTHLIKVACQAALGRKSYMPIYGDDYATLDGTCVRDYIDVCDLADAHILAMRHLLDGGVNLVVNCGYGQGWSVRQILDRIESVAQVDLDIRIEPGRPGDPATLVAACDRASRVLGWNPKGNIDRVLTAALAWEKTLIAER